MPITTGQRAPRMAQQPDISVVVGDGDLRPHVIAVLRSGSVMGLPTSSGAEVRLDVHVPMFD